MINIDEIVESWREDSKIDDLNLDKEISSKKTFSKMLKVFGLSESEVAHKIQKYATKSTYIGFRPYNYELHVDKSSKLRKVLAERDIVAKDVVKAAKKGDVLKARERAGIQKNAQAEASAKKHQAEAKAKATTEAATAEDTAE